MELKEIPLNAIKLPDYIARKEITDEEIIELAQSIKSIGLIEPIIVRTLPDGSYELVAGHRRYLAFKYLGRESIPAVIRIYTDPEAELAKCVENLMRKDLTPLEEALMIKRLIDQFNLSVNELSEKLNRSRSYIIARLELLEYPEHIKQMIANSEISLSVARELMMIDNENIRNYYFEYARRQGINAETARLWRQRYELDKSARVEFKPSEIGEMPIARPKYKCFFCGKDFEIIEIEYLQTCVNCKKIISEELKKS